MLDTTTNFVEQPDLVTERIGRFALIEGRERFIARTECGSGTFAGFGAIHPSINFAILASLAQGVVKASNWLWN